MSRTEFTAKTKRAAWMRSNGRCEHIDFYRSQDIRDGGDFILKRCNKKLFPGDIFYDHIVPDGLGGDNLLGNCQVLCRAHHDPKTFKADVPRIAKMKRQRDRNVGIKRTSFRPMPGSRASGWRKRMNGQTERRLP